MNGSRTFRIALLATLVPAMAGAQTTSNELRSVHWQPSVYAGAWGGGAAPRRPAESMLGPMLAFEMRRRDSKSRASVVATLTGYTKGGGRLTVDIPTPERRYELRTDLLTLGLGADWDLIPGRTEWTVGLSVAGGTSRATYREITTSGVSFTRSGDDTGWGGVTGLLAARSSVLLPIAARWGLRFGVEAVQGVESFSERRPMLGARVGLALLQ